ncbi:MAG: Pr6Pr family membrane protein [Vicinamibacteraceae bacterium]
MPTAIRLFLGALTIAAIGRQLAIHMAAGYSVVNFFSYFTNLSNLFAAGVLLRGATLWLARHQPSPGDERLRGMAVVYMTVVGVVFSILLRDVDLGALRPWINVLLHYVMPVVVVADWLLRPGVPPSSARDWLLVPAFPLAYVLYILARGAVVGWYPYPFLDPRLGGYGSVAVHVIAIMVLFLLTQWAVAASARRLGRRGTA